MLDVEASGWKGAAGSAIRNRREDELFYTGLVRRSAEAGALHLAFLRHEGRAIAFDFGIVSGGACLVLKASYREEYARYSAGHLVSLRHVRDMFDHGPPIYDMLGNGMTPHPYKLRFATHYRLFHRIRIFAPTPRASLLRRSYQALATARAVRKRLRQSRGGR